MAVESEMAFGPSHHVRPRGRGRVGYAPVGEFERVLRTRVDAQLSSEARRSPGGSLGDALAVSVWFFTSYTLLVFASLPVWTVAIVTCSLGLAIAGLLMMVGHDMCHHAVSKQRAIDKFVLWSSCGALGITPDWWRAKHNGLHHPYTNLPDLDDDICLGSLLRVTDTQPMKPWHRFQHIYAFGLAPFMFLNMVFIGDLRYVLTGRVGARPVTTPSPGRSVRLLTRKLAGVALLVGIALVLHPWLDVVLVTFVAALVAGEVLALVFQVQHCVADVSVPRRDIESGSVSSSWAVSQAQGAADFATSNRMLTWYVGGLNFHIEHHLFPHVAHRRLRELRPIVRATCADFGVHQTEYTTLTSAIVAHRRWLRALGSPPPAPGDLEL
jgi:linoleoyl-CoA desaturase